MTDKTKNKISVDLLSRLDWAEKTLCSILKGEKPRIDPDNKEQGWLYEQMIRMHADFFIPEVPKSYVTLPGETEEEIRLKGVTKLHPLSYAMSRRKTKIDQYLYKEGVRNYKVLGVDFGFRNVEKNPLEQNDYADAFVLTRGDMFALWQFTHFLKAKLETPEAYIGLSEKSLVLQNSGNRFWDPVIEGLGLKKYSKALREKIGLEITRVPSETKQVLSNSLGEWAGREPKKAKSVPYIEPGSTFLLATGNSKKVFELQDIMNAQKTGVRVVPFNTVFPKPEEAKETSMTYAGNNMEKAEKAWERLDALSSEEIETLLKDRGCDPAKTYLWFEDRGFETAENFFADGLFDECRPYLNPYKPGPGAEMAHVIKSMSIEDFYGRIDRVKTKIEKKRKLEGDATPVDLTVHDIAVYIMSPVLPDDNGHRPVYSFSAATDDSFVFSPRPANDTHKYSEHFQAPNNIPDDKVKDGHKSLDHFQVPNNIPDDRTKEEIEGYIENMSAMALAAKAAIYAFGMENNRKKYLALQTKFTTLSKSRIWKIGTQHSLRPGKLGQGSSGLGRRLNGDFSFMSENGEYDILKPNDYKLKEEGGKTRIVTSSLNNFFRFAVDADCFILTPESKKADMSAYFWQRMFIFYSLVVGKQIFDPVISSKVLAVLNVKGDQTWKPMLDIYTHLHAKSLIGDKPRHVFREFNTVKAASNHVKNRMKHYIPDNVPRPVYLEKGAKSPDDIFNVTVFCSATSTNGTLRDNARSLGFKLAAYGFGVKNGGGSGGVQEDFENLFDSDGFVREDVRREGLMVETSLGVHEFRHWWKANFKEEPPKTWVESIQCDQTFQAEGLCEFNDRAVVYPNIFYRMDDLANTDAFIVDAGGAGTVQEMAAVLMLREASLLNSRNVPFIIVNTETGKGAHKNTIWGPLIEMMTPEMKRSLNIHVVDNHDEAIQICRDARAVRGMEPDNVPDYKTLLSNNLRASVPAALGL